MKGRLVAFALAACGGGTPRPAPSIGNQQTAPPSASDERGGTYIAGRVTSSNGVPLIGVSVVFEPKTVKTARRLSTATAMDGSYLDDVPPDTYRVTFQYPDDSTDVTVHRWDVKATRNQTTTVDQQIDISQAAHGMIVDCMDEFATCQLR